jgi:hypothetical protein
MIGLTRMFHELPSRERGDDCATGLAAGSWIRGVLEQYVAGEPVLSEVEGTPEDARKDGQIHGRSRQLVKYLG